MIRPDKNQKGFGITEVLIITVILGLLGFVGWTAFQKISQSKSSGSFVSKNYGIGFEGQSDSNYVYQYKISVGFRDSFDPKDVCPARLEDFQGKLSVDYQSDTNAQISVLQNVESHESTRGAYGTCPTVIVPALTKDITIDKKWIESGNARKTIQINSDVYELLLDKQARTISFSGKDYKQVEPYLPDDLAQLYASPMYDNCMTIAQIQAYAKEHDIAEADSTYPGLTTTLTAIPNIVLEAPDGSRNVLLVIADTYVKQLVEKTNNEKGSNEACRVVASKPVYTFVSP